MPALAAGIANVYLDYQSDQLRVVERAASGRVTIRPAPAEHVLYVRTAELTRSVHGELTRSASVRSITEEGEWRRVSWHDRQSAIAGAHWLREEREIEVCEAGVSPIRRWCVDHGVIPARPRAVFLDLEADSRVSFADKEQMRILCWSLIDAETRAGQVELLYEDSDEDEARLLKLLWTALDDYDQVISWNGDRFDFALLRARTKKRRLGIDVGRWLWLDHMLLFERMNKMAAESGAEKQSLGLQAVALEVTGLGKLEGIDGAKSWEYWAAGGVQRAELAKYNLRDSELMLGIEDKTGYIGLLNTVCEVTGTFADTRGSRPAGQVESFLLRLARERGQHLKTQIPRLSSFDEDEGASEPIDQYRGAYVMAPTESGILRDVHVADFSAMYPSIIISWNMSPETRRDRPSSIEMGRPLYLPPQTPKVVARPDDCCEAALTGTWFALEPKGMLPLSLEELLKLRKYWSNLQASLPPGTPEWIEAGRRSTAYKIVANSFYGVAGSPTSMFFDVGVAEGTTQCGEWLIKQTMEQARARGWRPIYGDTDSVFIRGATDAEFRGFCEWLNDEYFPAILRALGCRENRIKIAYEKKFRRLVFTAAKRYIGAYAHYKGTPATAESEPEIKGLEYKRGDVNRFTRQMQSEVIDLFARKDEDDPAVYLELVERWRARILGDPLELADVMLSKGLGKSLKEYAVKLKKDGSEAGGSPHVAIAKILKERGRDVGMGTKIEYVVIDGHASPMQCIPAEDWAGECDRHYLWEQLVWPATERVLMAAFPDRDWKRFDRTRPAAPRGRAKVCDEQMSLLERIRR